jgi:hypothetical protein
MRVRELLSLLCRVIVRRPRVVELPRQHRKNLLALITFSKMFQFLPLEL